MYLVERSGRRKLLLYSLAGVTVSLVLLSIPFWLGQQLPATVLSTDPPFPSQQCKAPLTPIHTCDRCIRNDCTFCYNEEKQARDGWCVASGSADACGAVEGFVSFSGACPNPYRFALLLAVMLYLSSFSFGMGPVPWVVNSEIYPVSIRGLASGIAGTANWVTNAIVSQTFLLLMNSITPAGTFLVCASVAVAGFVWVYHFVPETKGLSLGEIQGLFAKRAATSPPPEVSGESSALIDVYNGGSSSSSAPAQLLGL
jgi:MFS transporter, SP family, solute carrier family 2 (myo-inositol transporter), member 13